MISLLVIRGKKELSEDVFCFGDDAPADDRRGGYKVELTP